MGGADAQQQASMQVDTQRSFDIPSPTKDIAASAPAPAPASTAASQKGVAKYSSGQELYYKNSTMTAKAKVVKVHFDDALEPFYTIAVDGKEKQTDDSHLFMDHPIQTDIAKVLQGMSETQLKQVLEYVNQMNQPSSGMGGIGSASLQPQSFTQSSPSPNTGMAQPVPHSPVPNMSTNQTSNTAALSPAPTLAPFPGNSPQQQSAQANQGMPSPSSMGHGLSMLSPMPCILGKICIKLVRGSVPIAFVKRAIITANKQINSLFTIYAISCNCWFRFDFDLCRVAFSC